MTEPSKHAREATREIYGDSEATEIIQQAIDAAVAEAVETWRLNQHIPIVDGLQKERDIEHARAEKAERELAALRLAVRGMLETRQLS